MKAVKCLDCDCTMILDSTIEHGSCTILYYRCPVCGSTIEQEQYNSRLDAYKAKEVTTLGLNIIKR